jgi:hypothetical protein
MRDPGERRVPEYIDHARRGDYNQFQLTPPVFEPGFQKRPGCLSALLRIAGYPEGDAFGFKIGNRSSQSSLFVVLAVFAVSV